MTEPTSKERIKKGAAALGAVFLSAALLAYGVAASQIPEEEIELEEETLPALNDGDSYDDFFYGTENWGFMSPETMSRFQRQFYEWLTDSGAIEQGAYVYLHAEEITCEDGIWVAYARTPLNDIYYRISFDPQNKEISYEESPAPGFATTDSGARETLQGPESTPVAAQDETGQEDSRNAAENISVDDVDALAALMPQQAADSLGRIVCEYAASKDIETSAPLCSVYPSSVSTSSTVTTMDVLVYDSQKNGYLIKADYDSSSNLFGMALSPL